MAPLASRASVTKPRYAVVRTSRPGWWAIDSGSIRTTAATMKTAPAYLVARYQSLRSESISSDSGDGARGPQRFERRAVVTEKGAEDFVRVLARRRHRAHARGRLRELDRRAGQVHLAGHGVVALDQHLALPQVRVLGHLRDGAHRRHRDAGRQQLLHDVLHAVRGAPRLDLRATLARRRAARQRRVVGGGAGELHPAPGPVAPAGGGSHPARPRPVPPAGAPAPLPAP